MLYKSWYEILNQIIKKLKYLEKQISIKTNQKFLIAYLIKKNLKNELKLL